MDVLGAVKNAGLGEVLDRYRQSILIELSFAVPCLMIGAAGLIWGDGLGRGLGGAFVALGLATGAAAWVKSRRRLYLCAGGLLTADGRAVTNVVAWDDVASIRVWVTRSYNLGSYEDLQRCTLHLRNGKRMNLARPPYAHAERLAERVEQRVVELAYPRHKAELDDTGVTAFGPIIVTAEGIRYRDRVTAWQDIARIQRGRVRLRVWSTTRRRPVISGHVRTIPDIRVLTRIMAERAEQARSDIAITADRGTPPQASGGGRGAASSVPG